MNDQETLAQSIYHRFGAVLWGGAVIGVVLLALYVSIGRIMIGNLQSFQGELMAALNARVPFRIEAAALRGEWHAFTPEIVLSELRVSLPDADVGPLELSSGRIGLDVLGTLLTRSPRFRSLQLDDLELHGELTPEGRLVFPGFSGGDTDAGLWLRDFLLNIEYLTLRGNVLRLGLPNGGQRRLSVNLHLAREGSSRELQARLTTAQGITVAVAGRGVGNPFEPQDFTGQLFLDVGTSDLDALRDLLTTEPMLWVEGQLDSRWWLAWDRGTFDVDLQLQFDDLRLFPNDRAWSVPLDRLSLSASLLDRQNRWTVFASDLVASRGDASLRVPRLQLDAWGKSLRLRTQALDLAAMSQLVQALGVLPDSAASVVDILDARGSLQNLQLSVSDLGEPLDDWEVEANFDALSVQSWRGAPGVEGAQGYLEMSRAGGRVVLDSQDFSMAFPTVYEQPLRYEDFNGTIYLSWDEQALALASGPVTAIGEEGTARALFGLSIPLKPGNVGMEMDLMVGVEHSHPMYRVKYIPTVLNDNLRNWLDTAIGDGRVEQGAFIWRGSLLREARDHRTVQLFFNVTDTELSYHPQWPTVNAIDGVVLIDDSDVSVWADSARMYEAELARLSVESWLTDSGQMLLAVDGSLSGTAADGLRIVNDSLLGDLTQGAFRQWRASGDLQARLELLLDLAQPGTPPEVSVTTELQDVTLEVVPGGLQLEAISGGIDYASATGFSSRDLQGVIWQRPFDVTLHQRPLVSGAQSLALGESRVEVDIATRVDLADVKAWLNQPALEFVSGETGLTGQILVQPGQTPVLLVASDLAGAALDLPPPWTKTAAQSGKLQLQIPLGAGGGPLAVRLNDELKLLLDITGGGFNAASIGVGREPPELSAGIVRVTGQAGLVAVDEWLAFVDRYLQPAAPALPAAEARAAPPAIRIDEMYADTLRLWGREVEDVRFSVALDERAWQLRAETAWLRGSYFQPEDGRAGLKLDYLDIAGLGTALAVDADDRSEAAAGDPLELPDMQVIVSDLRRDATELGNLQFQLTGDGQVLRAWDIHGEIAGLRLDAEQPGRLEWEYGRETRLETALVFTDIGDTLARLAFPRFLETSAGQLQLALAWPGSPGEFELINAQGSLGIDVQRGTFLETPAGTSGALRILSIFNLAEIVQQLSLSHMFESGVPFRQMGGQVNFLSGTIDLPDLAIIGSSSSFNFSGTSRIADHSLDGELVATLPVASNLPWVAALAGGLPVAAGVFVVSKVFEKQVNRLSSGVYRISGTWEEPLVEFDRIFDDAARAAGSPSPALEPVTVGEAPAGRDSRTPQETSGETAGESRADQAMPPP